VAAVSAPQDISPVFAPALSAGAILTGFCGTFLTFRIQREAAYYRQPALDFRNGRAKDILIDLTHFSSAFFLLILATVCSAVFGFVLPLMALTGSAWITTRPKVVVAGMISGLVLVGGYFVTELVHYRVLRRLPGDTEEWKREGWVLAATVLLAFAAFAFVFCSVGAQVTLP
jgi:hypothetical protein